MSQISIIGINQILIPISVVAAIWYKIYPERHYRATMPTHVWGLVTGLLMSVVCTAILATSPASNLAGTLLMWYLVCSGWMLFTFHVYCIWLEWPPRGLIAR